MANAPLTKTNIERKLNRKRNPVTNMAQLAREFGYDTTYVRSDLSTGNAAPRSFRNKVKELVGARTYKSITDRRFVNHSYR